MFRESEKHWHSPWEISRPRRKWIIFWENKFTQQHTCLYEASHVFSETDLAGPTNRFLVVCENDEAQIVRSNRVNILKIQGETKIIPHNEKDAAFGQGRQYVQRSP